GENIMTLEMTPPPTTQEPEAVVTRSGLGVLGHILSWIGLAVAGLVVLGLLAVTIGPRFLPYQALIVRSGSMSPTIPTGSIVFYRKIAADSVRVGDVIVFTKPGDASEKVTHRVVKIGTGATGR